MIDDYDYAEHLRTRRDRPASEPPVSDYNVGDLRFAYATPLLLEAHGIAVIEMVKLRAYIETERAQAAKAFGEEVDRRALAERDAEKFMRERNDALSVLRMLVADARDAKAWAKARELLKGYVG